MMEDDATNVIEGFLCPICLRDLGSFHQLQSHFEAEHSSAEKQVFGQIKGLFGSVKKVLNAPVAVLNPFEGDASDADTAYVPKRNPLLTTQESPGADDHTSAFKSIRSRRLNQFVIQSNSLVIRLQKLVNFAPVDDPRLRRSMLDAFEKDLVSWVDDSHVTLCPGCGRKFLPAVRKKHHCRLCGAIMCDECSVNLDMESARKLQLIYISPAFCKSCITDSTTHATAAVELPIRDTATPTGAAASFTAESSSHTSASAIPVSSAPWHVHIRTRELQQSSSPASSTTSSSSPRTTSFHPSNNRHRFNSDSTLTSSLPENAEEQHFIGDGGNDRSRSPSIASHAATSDSSSRAAGGGGRVGSLLGSVRMPRFGSFSTTSQPTSVTHADNNNVHGDRFSNFSGTTTASSSLKDDLKALATRYGTDDGLVLVKMCRPCWQLVERRARAKHRSSRAHDTALAEKYDALRAEIDAADALFHKYETMAAALRAADATIDLDEANRLRMRLCVMFEHIDTAGKALLINPNHIAEESDPEQVLLHATTRDALLRRKIRQFCVDFLQRRCLVMTPLPTPADLAALKAQREDERQRRWAETHRQLEQQRKKQQNEAPKKPVIHGSFADPSTSARAKKRDNRNAAWHAKASGFVPMPLNPFVLDVSDDPLLQQITQIREYLQQARAANKVDEVRMLEANLSELNDAYQQQLFSSTENGEEGDGM